MSVAACHEFKLYLGLECEVWSEAGRLQRHSQMMLRATDNREIGTFDQEIHILNYAEKLQCIYSGPLNRKVCKFCESATPLRFSTTIQALQIKFFQQIHQNKLILTEPQDSKLGTLPLQRARLI